MALAQHLANFATCFLTALLQLCGEYIHKHTHTYMGVVLFLHSLEAFLDVCIQLDVGCTVNDMLHLLQQLLSVSL